LQKHITLRRLASNANHYQDESFKVTDVSPSMHPHISLLAHQQQGTGVVTTHSAQATELERPSSKSTSFRADSFPAQITSEALKVPRADEGHGLHLCFMIKNSNPSCGVTLLVVESMNTY